MQTFDHNSTKFKFCRPNFETWLALWQANDVTIIEWSPASSEHTLKSALARLETANKHFTHIRSLLIMITIISLHFRLDAKIRIFSACELAQSPDLIVLFASSYIRLVESIIYWRDVQKSAVIFGAGLTLLLAIATFSVISVVAYTSILILLATVSFRVYKTVQAAVHKTNEGHPFK